MNKPVYNKNDEEIKELIGLPETTEGDLEDELDKLPAWKEFQNDGMDSITFGDY